jgi:perosamine synthetase
LEDCSHAHGARFDDLPVGSFGKAAAWSLQSKKTIWAGEGGVLSTDDTSVFERALLLGHFNKRALHDIDPASPNHAYAFTGTGLKYRAHPLGLTLALPQVKVLDELVAGRQWFAARLLEALAEVPGLEVLGSSDRRRYHGYYALVGVIDPVRAGFTNREFVDALRAENLHTADVPGQMTSLHRLPVFAALGTCTHGPLPNSTRISQRAVKFFVPHDRNSDDDSTLSELTARAVRKVSRLLGARR